MKSKRKPCYASKGLPKVPGKPKGTDIIPAWLTPGEAVLSPGAAEMLGRGNVQALNKAASTMRLGTPQYKAEGEEQMQPNYAALGNQRADEILGNPDMFNSRELQAANRYMDPAGLAGGPSLARDQAFLGGTRSLESINNPVDPETRQQYTQAQQGLFGGNQPMRLGGDDGTSEGLSAAQEAVGGALSYGRQAAQDAIQQGQQARYMAQGGIVQPGYYALGTDFVDDLARQQPPTFNGRVGGFSLPNYEPFKMPAPQPSALSSARSAINAGATPIGELASSAAKGIGNAASSAGNLAGRAFGAVGNLAKNTAVGAARIGPAAMGIEGAARGFMTPTEDYAKRIGIDTPTSTAGQMGVRALGVLSDVGASGLGMLGIDQRGKFADVAAQRAQNPPAANPILGRPAQAAEQRQPGQSAMTQPQQQPSPARVGTGNNTQAYYQEGMIQDGASSRLTPSQAQTDFVNSGRPASSLSKDELYKIYPSARDAAAKDAFDASQRATYQKQGLAVPWDMQTPEQRVQTQGRETAMAQRQAQNASAIGNQMAGLNMSAQRQALGFMNNALTILNNPGGYTNNQLWAAKTMLDRLAPVAQTGVSSSSQFYNTDANRGLTAAQANQANSAAKLNYSTASMNDEKVRQERLGLTQGAGMRLGGGSVKANDPGKYYSVDTGIPDIGNLLMGPNNQPYRLDPQTKQPIPVTFPQPQTPAQLFSRFNSPAELIAWARSKEQRDKYSDVSDEALASEWNKVQQAR